MARQRTYATKAECADRGFLDKITLKALRLKPTPETPSTEYWQGRGVVRAYDRTQCVPMRDYRPASAVQAAALAAGRQLVGTALCKTCGERFDQNELRRGKCTGCIEKKQLDEIREELEHWMTLSPLFLDTETTGLNEEDQVVEIAVLNAEGEMLYHSLVRPTVQVSDGATAVHGITEAELASAPAWPEIYPTIKQLIAGRIVVAHNVSFDARLIQQTCRAHNLPDISYESRCTMSLLTALNNGRWPRLSRAVELAGVEFPGGDAHRAQCDAECVRRIVVDGFQ